MEAAFPLRHEAPRSIARSADGQTPVRPFLRDTERHASAVDREMIEATNEALCLFGSKWKVDVLYLLAAGVRRRAVVHDHLLVSKRVLTEVLRALERDGLVRRNVLDDMPVRVEYTLTPLGRSLTAPLFALFEWSEEHMEKVHTSREEHDARRCESADAGDGPYRPVTPFRLVS
jgi:DNA-binding HxlR family transcriptional regulator